MKSRMKLIAAATLVAALSTLLATSCMPSGDPQSSSQTNWYRRCNSNAECGDLACLCGTCTQLCSSQSDCKSEGSSCLAASDERASTFCEGSNLPWSICVLGCDDDSCPEGTVCKEEVCQVLPAPDAIVTVDLTERYQTLIGFGASLAYAESTIVGREDEEELYDALFSELGAEVIRVGNLFEPGREGNLEPSARIISAAADRIGAQPTLLMTSASPPAELKANGARVCNGDEATCTLVQLADGSYDYEGFAQFWRSSLEAYASVGISPAFVSIQNNANWSPPEGNAGEACRFLPEEGTTTLGDVEVRLAGYVEAAEAVEAALVGLESAPALYGPETTSLNAVPRYEPVFAANLLSAVGIHLYGMSIDNPRTDELNAVRALGSYYDIPVIQSEMMAQGLDTAVYIHHAAVEANATAYLQNDFVSQAGAPDPNENALIQLEETSGFVRQSAYYALQHFSKNTKPGWVRVGANVDGGAVLASGWLSPAADALTLILVNPGANALRTQLELSELGNFENSNITQTVFDAVLEHRELGALDEFGYIDLPAHSAVTIALTE